MLNENAENLRLTPSPSPLPPPPPKKKKKKKGESYRIWMQETHDFLGVFFRGVVGRGTLGNEEYSSLNP